MVSELLLLLVVSLCKNKNTLCFHLNLYQTTLQRFITNFVYPQIELT